MYNTLQKVISLDDIWQELSPKLPVFHLNNILRYLTISGDIWQQKHLHWTQKFVTKKVSWNIVAIYCQVETELSEIFFFIYVISSQVFLIRIRIIYRNFTVKYLILFGDVISVNAKRNPDSEKQKSQLSFCHRSFNASDPQPYQDFFISSTCEVGWLWHSLSHWDNSWHLLTTGYSLLYTDQLVTQREKAFVFISRTLFLSQKERNYLWRIQKCFVTELRLDKNNFSLV